MLWGIEFEPGLDWILSTSVILLKSDTSYAVKYASNFYGPFRNAVGSRSLLKGDKRTYQIQELKLNNGDWVFMYSDGYYDQFGGPKNKSMGNIKFKEINTTEDSLENIIITILKKLNKNDWMR